MAIIATWSFGLQAVNVARQIIQQNGCCMDALERGINDVEDDPTTGPYYIGKGSHPNSNGVLQLDAALMRGSDCRVGAVAALEGYAKAISVARCVMDTTEQSLIVGKGAADLARKRGFPLVDNDTLLTEQSKAAYKEWLDKQVQPTSTGHDTLSMLCMDLSGGVAAGVSTSGPPFKLPGRVGDSPLPGCGLYADDMVGAAAATGDGDQIMQFCPSFHIVQLMREGLSAEEACLKVVSRMKESCHNKDFEAAVIATDKKGHLGAAGTVKRWVDFRTKVEYDGFPFVIWKLGMEEPVIKTASPL